MVDLTPWLQFLAKTYNSDLGNLRKGISQMYEAKPHFMCTSEISKQVRDIVLEEECLCEKQSFPVSQ